MPPKDGSRRLILYAPENYHIRVCENLAKNPQQMVIDANEIWGGLPEEGAIGRFADWSASFDECDVVETRIIPGYYPFYGNWTDERCVLEVRRGISINDQFLKDYLSYREVLRNSGKYRIDGEQLSGVEFNKLLQEITKKHPDVFPTTVEEIRIKDFVPGSELIKVIDSIIENGRNVKVISDYWGNGCFLAGLESKYFRGVSLGQSIEGSKPGLVTKEILEQFVKGQGDSLFLRFSLTPGGVESVVEFKNPRQLDKHLPGWLREITLFREVGKFMLYEQDVIDKANNKIFAEASQVGLEIKLQLWQKNLALEIENLRLQISILQSQQQMPIKNAQAAEASEQKQGALPAASAKSAQVEHLGSQNTGLERK